MARTDVSPLPLAALISAVLALGVFLVAGGLSHGSSSLQFPNLGLAGHHSAPAELLPPQALAFEPAARGDAYLVRGADYELTVDAGGTRVTGRGGDIRTHLVGAGAAFSTPSQRETLVVNRYEGDKAHWRTGIPTFGRVAYRSVYPGIDLTYHGRSGKLEYDFVV